MVHQARMQTVSLETIDQPPAAIDLNLAAATMEKALLQVPQSGPHRRGAQGCPGLARNREPDESPAEFRDLARRLPHHRFLPGLSDGPPKGSVTAASLEVGRALVDQRCGRCHSLDRVYKTAQTPEEWRATVTEMVGFRRRKRQRISAPEKTSRSSLIYPLRKRPMPSSKGRRKPRPPHRPAAAWWLQNFCCSRSSSAPQPV